MNKKLTLLVATFLSLFFLTACANQNTSKGEGQSSSSTMNTMDFTKEVTQYMEKQQALMLKQNEEQSGEFEDVSKHSKEVLESKEYKAWEEAARKIDGVKISKTEKNSEGLEKLQSALKEYNSIQSDYFKKVAQASSAEEYNKVSDDMENQLSESQDKFIDAMNHLS